MFPIQFVPDFKTGLRFCPARQDFEETIGFKYLKSIRKRP